ncbi:ribosome recycling factor [Spiroplasma sabaudiense Ar-1343]|uniref:Ribosome-recycling factor n=1 Tax=Spiroplasma sabaudiense Ar-1343 TaxID=1276257 RepID=W6A9T5_9MOLU|nr:ribosome recycling factor [Spiroplasma sabaudiense]AHI53635.1 ribosome recycling factor [Spiroplasma sabaudiense Ar-1343]
MNQIILENTKEAMTKIVDAYNEYIKKIRTGRANASMLSSVMVDSYGTPTPINQTAQISAPEPQQLVIKPFDRSQISNIVAGINKANLGLNPLSEADLIRINIPALTEEIRKDLVKKLKSELEAFKIRVRNERRDAMDKAKKSKEISEDLVKDLETKIQKLTDETITKLDNATKIKEEDIMKI